MHRPFFGANIYLLIAVKYNIKDRLTDNLRHSKWAKMETDSIRCRRCGGTSFFKDGETAKCGGCGAEYDIALLRADAERPGAERNAPDASGGLYPRPLSADEKEARLRKYLEEEKRRLAAEQQFDPESRRRSAEAERRNLTKLTKRACEAREEEGRRQFQGCYYYVALVIFVPFCHDFFYDKSIMIFIILFTVLVLALPFIFYRPDNNDKNRP